MIQNEGADSRKAGEKHLTHLGFPFPTHSLTTVTTLPAFVEKQ